MSSSIFIRLLDIGFCFIIIFLTSFHLFILSFVFLKKPVLNTGEIVNLS